ncbi:MAG: WG repeat-containing protein [Butyrivibrio sp.]|nr:WG repeat-containing protein [Butyrivibrio sp.]
MIREKCNTYKDRIIKGYVLFFCALVALLGCVFIRNIISIGKVKESGFYYIDKAGKIVNSTPIKDEDVTPFNEDGIAYVRGMRNGIHERDEGFMNINGDFKSGNGYDADNICDEFCFPLIVISVDSVEVIDKNMNVLVEKEYRFGDNIYRCYSDFSQGLALFQKEDCKENKALCGFVNEKLEWVIEPKYSLAQPFTKDKIAAVQNPETKLWGYVKGAGDPNKLV